LRDYGFDVVWDGAARALHISRNEAVTQLTRKDIYDPSYPSGTKFSDIYASDIKVDYNGTPITSYALNGYTLIPINDFAMLAGSEQWLGDVRAYKVWVDGLSTCEYQPLTQRCRNLWYQVDYTQEMPKIDIWEDMNSDGQYENVVLSIVGKDRYDYINVGLKIGNSYMEHIEEEGWTYGINAVYIADLVPNDNAKEIAVFFECDSGDPVMKVFRYKNGNIETLQFRERDDYISDSLWTGNTTNYPFILNDDGSFTLNLRTRSEGMWRVYASYKLNEYGYIERVYQDSYIVDDSSWSWNKNQWGYWYVKETCTWRGLVLYAGDWIKVIADDMKGNILIQKSNGQQGWFYVGTAYDHTDPLWDYSDMFMMAG